MDDAQLRREMEGLSFYHTIPLTPTLSTPGWPVVLPIVDMVLRAMRATDFRGKRVLDIGCRDGLFCFEAERLGAAEVLGIDNDLAPGVPEFLIRTLKSKARIESVNLFDLRPETHGKFDVIVFPGVLYHLRHPFWALKLVQDVLVEGGTLILETAVLVDDNRHAMLYCPTGAESPYEPTSVTFFNRKGLSDTLESMGFRDLIMSPNVFGTPRAPANAKTPTVDRCVVIGRNAPAQTEVRRYWEGTPNAHAIPTWDGKRAAV